MAVGCGAKFAKIILFAFNVIFWLAGLALLIIGIIFLLNKKIGTFQEIMTDDQPALTASAVVLIVIGGISCVVGFAGCCGAIKESPCLLLCYAIMLGALLIVEVVIAIFMAVRMGAVTASIGDEFTRVMNLYPADLESNRLHPMKELVDRLQFDLFKCCGSNSSSDWTETDFYRNQSSLLFRHIVPPSCCSEMGYQNYTELQYKTCATINSPLIFSTGCKEAITQWIKSNYPIIIAVAAVVAGIEAIGIIFSICLCMSIRSRDTATRRAV